MAAEDAAEATLELTLLSADLLKKPKPSSNFLISRSASPSSSSFAVAWIDPSIKKSTKTLDNNLLHFPLPTSILRNPSSLLTVQIRSSRVPFATPKLVGTATLLLSSLLIGRRGDVRTLQLLKPSGRSRGIVRVVARIMWCLGEMPEPPDVPCIPCPNRPPPPPPPPSMDFLGIDLPYIVDPSAPPMPEEDSGSHDLMGVNSGAPMMEDESRDCDWRSVGLREKYMGMPDDKDSGSHDLMSVNSGAPMMEDESRDCDWLSVGLREKDMGMPDDKDSSSHDLMSVNSGAPMMEDESMDCDWLSVGLREKDMGMPDDSTEQFVPRNIQFKQDGHVNEDGHGKGAWRSFLVGLASGTFAAVLMGAAAFSEG